MMAYLLENKEAAGVKAVLDRIEEATGTYEFATAFSIILTDRGGEFRFPDALECGKDNIIRTSVYYCDPMCSWQKPHCEKNHEYIRKICPKGTSFDKLTQTDIDHMMNHINSYRRAKLGNKTPYEAFIFYYGKEALEKRGYSQIDPSCVVMTPKLFKR